MGYNRSGVVRKARLKRRRQEVRRFVARCEETNAAAQKQGKPATDFTRAINDFAEFRKWP
jgi:hypothetical protein